MRRAFVVVAVAALVAAVVVTPAGVFAAADGGRVDAQTVSLSVGPLIAYTGLFGVVENPVANGVSVKDVVARTTYYNGSGIELRADTVPVDCWVLDPGSGWATFEMPFNPPAGFAYMTHDAYGTSTATGRVSLYTSIVTQGILPSGQRWYRIRVQNSNPFTVVGAKLAAREYFTQLGGSPELWGRLEPSGAYQERLAPDELMWVELRSYRALSGYSGEYNVSYCGEALQAPPTNAVYRFYNTRSGTHFYTIDPTERDSVMANLWWLYSYEGEAFSAYATPQASTMPLYRFYNRRTGTHFYTADAGERDNVIATLGWLYQYEGPGFYIANGGGLATNQMFRFYNKRTGTHFYTGDTAERDIVIANLGWLYDFEGAAFNVPK